MQAPASVRVQARSRAHATIHEKRPRFDSRMLTRYTIAVAIVLAPACSPSPSDSKPAAAAPAATSSEVTGVVPKNAIVTLLPPSGPPPMPAEPAVMDQISKQFLPHTLLVRVGQTVEFR